MWEDRGQGYFKRTVGGRDYLATKAASEAEAEAAAAMAGPIEVTLGALLRAMDSTGGKSSMRKEAEEDSGEGSEMGGMRSEMQRLAKALTEEFTSAALHRERARARAQQAAYQPHEADHASLSRRSMKSQREVRVNAADRNLGRTRKKYTNRNTKNHKAQHEEAGRPQESVTEAGKAVADINSEGSCSFIQEESEFELGKRLQMETRPEKQPNAEEEDYFRKAILRALLDIKEKLSNKNTDEDTLLLLLLLLKGMSNRLDQGGYEEKNEIAKGKSAIETCLDTNDGTDTTLVQSDTKPAAFPSATKSMTIQAETLHKMVKAASDSINDSTDTTMVESDIKPAADLSASNSITIQADTLQQMVKDFSDSMRSVPAIQEHTRPMVGSSDTLVIRQPADPNATDSVTRLGQYSLQDDLDHDKMAKKTTDKEITKKTAYTETADQEEKQFAYYRSGWESMWSKTCGSFEHMTALSSMHFTYYTPGYIPPCSRATKPETLQIFSIKLAEIADSPGFIWPLSVYGVVAVRDAVDRNRNFLFYCGRKNAQELTQNDPFLRLIGPCRAVVCEETVNFEVELKVKGTTTSQDKALIVKDHCCNVFGYGASTVSIENCFCKIDLCVQPVRRTIQATILGVQVASSEQWPFKYGARVACSSLPGKLHVTEDNQVVLVTDPASGELVMVDSKDGAKLKGGDDYLHLSRNVISVESQGRLDVDIQAYSESGGIAAQQLVSFPTRFSKITRKSCFFGDVTVLITVAWSLVATEKLDVISHSAYVI